MDIFLSAYQNITRASLVTLLFTLVGCDSGTKLNHLNTGVKSPVTGHNEEILNTPQIPVSEIMIEKNGDFNFQQDSSTRSDKVIGFFEFTLKDVTNNRFIRNLNNSNMIFEERQIGSDEPFIVEVEATQSSDIKITPIDVMYLIDTSFSVVQANASLELTKQANNLANEINNRNRASGTVAEDIRYRTFADSVSSLQTDTSESPFSQINFEERGGGTALYEGIELALSDLSSSAQPLLFVFTDGRENASSPGYNLDLILNHAVNNEIPIFIAGLGNVDSNTLSQIATTTGGQFFQAESVDQLPAVFEDVLYSIPAQYTVSYRPTQRTGHVEFQFIVEYGSATALVPGSFNVDEILE